jgi:predicted GNAT family N-acyltransferase
MALATKPFSISLLSWTEALPLARPVREQVFILEQGVPRELEWDDLDEDSDHAVALDSNSNAIGTGRLLAQGRIGRMAVLKNWRGQGVGAAVLVRLIEQARARGMGRLTLHAQTQAAGFYRRFGFAPCSEVYVEAQIPHLEMFRDIGPS